MESAAKARGATIGEAAGKPQTLSVLGTFELDGNAITGVLGSSGSTTVSHDWDQVFADNGVPPPVSGAVASSFVTDKVNSTDDIFRGGVRKTSRDPTGPAFHRLQAATQG